jgi:hypothetical protein
MLSPARQSPSIFKDSRSGKKERGIEADRFLAPSIEEKLSNPRKWSNMNIRHDGWDTKGMERKLFQFPQLTKLYIVTCVSCPTAPDVLQAKFADSLASMRFKVDMLGK